MLNIIHLVDTNVSGADSWLKVSPLCSTSTNHTAKFAIEILTEMVLNNMLCVVQIKIYQINTPRFAILFVFELVHFVCKDQILYICMVFNVCTSVLMSGFISRTENVQSPVE